MAAVNRTVNYDKSRAEILASLPEAARREFLSKFTEHALKQLYLSWDFWARPKQKLPQVPFNIWFIVSGRGFGKTRTGAETIREWVRQGYTQLALVGQTKSDIRDTMLFGASGLMTICKNDVNKPEYIASKRVVIWPNGASAFLYSGDEPEQLRGPQHEKAWVDELVKFKKMHDTWSNLDFGLRLGDNPQTVVTTTPKPFPLLKELINDTDTHVTTGSTYENYGNLSHKFIKRVIKKYEGTRLGDQELWGAILSDIQGALWKSGIIEALRVDEAPALKRIVVAIDPAVTSKSTSDETGIIAAGLGKDGHGYVLEDKSLLAAAKVWAAKAVETYKDLRADRIIGEINNGGELIETVIKFIDPNVSYAPVWASRGKYTRAEPVAALYEQGKVHHVGNREKFEFLETEMTEWIPSETKESPNRMDATVWALSELMIDKTEPKGKIRPLPIELRRGF